MSNIKLYLGDCLEVMQGFEANCIDLTVTSPPYDNLRTYKNNIDKVWCEGVWKPIIQELFRVTKQGGVVVWVVGDATKNFNETSSSFKQALYFKECGFNLLDTMIWQKPNYAPMYPNVRRYDSNFEFMFIFSKGKPKTFNPIKDVIKKESSKQRSKYKTSYIKKDGKRKYTEKTENNKDFCKRNNIWIIPNGQIRGLKHPAVFPEQLANDHILSWSNEGDTVLDPFLGSGTTGKMAKLNNRNFIGIELSEEYIKIAQARIKNTEPLTLKQ